MVLELNRRGRRNVLHEVGEGARQGFVSLVPDLGVILGAMKGNLVVWSDEWHGQVFAAGDQPGWYMGDALWECTLEIPAEIASFPERGLGDLD